MTGAGPPGPSNRQTSSDRYPQAWPEPVRDVLNFRESPFLRPIRLMRPIQRLRSRAGARRQPPARTFPTAVSKPLRIKTARRRFKVARDAHGVPQVTGRTWRDVLHGLGFMHFTDRPTQMLFARAMARGRAAELISDQPELLETDRFFRRVGLFLNVEEEIRRLDDPTFDDLTAYCEGVNDAMQQWGRSLPMVATRFALEPWTQASILLIGNLLNFGGLAIGQQQNERLLLELIHSGIPEDKLRELFGSVLDGADFELLRQVKISNQLSDEALELITDLPRLAGSNAWAVAPSRTATGSALLASDPHLEVNRLPAIWYEALLRWEEGYLCGATLPGSPMFAVGRTEHVAWGVTYLKGDTSDYFIEDCRRGPSGWQYRRGEDWHDFKVRQEILERKSGSSETLLVRSNPQGTLEGDPETTGPGYYLSVAWTGSQEGVGRSVATWNEVPRCRSSLELIDLVRQCPQPTLVWVSADRQGHIGLQANGWFPIRGASTSGMVPAPAWDERNHWQGRVPIESLPRIYDPPEGFVASANEDINPPGGPQLISVPVPDHRKRRIVERLGQMPEATLADMQALQYDVISLQARDLVAIFLPHLPAGSLRDRLAAWDFNYAPESTEATLFSRLYRHVLLEIFGHSSGIGWRRMLYLSSRVGYSTMVITCIDRLLTREHSLWWEDRDKGELIRRAAEKMQQQAEPEQPWAVTNAFRFTNRFFESQKVGRALGFHTGDLPMPGCHATPFQGHLLRAARRETTFAPSYHFVVDLASDEAWTNLPGGPSESRFSRWYKNLIPLWCAGKYKRLGVDPLAPRPDEI